MKHQALIHRGASAGAISALAGALVLSACATLPTPETSPSIAAPGHFATQASLAALQTAWPSDQWWKEFNDPQLNALIEEGLAGATDLRIAAARFSRAEALARQARGKLLPSIGASGEAGIAKRSSNFIVPEALSPDGSQDYAQVGINLSWDLDFWGRNRAAFAAARSEAEAAGAEAAAAKLAVSAGVAQAYADLAGLFVERDAAENAIGVRRHTLELMSVRTAQGLENNATAERVRSALASAEGDREALDEAITLTRNRIAALVGAGPDRGLSIGRPAITARAEFGLPANLPADLIGRRPDIVAARLRSEAAASSIHVARAAFYPNVSLTGMAGLQSIGFDKLTNPGSDFGLIGPAVTLPIFNGGQLKGRYRAAEAEYRAAVAQYDGTLTQALREVADVIASHRALERRLDRATEAERAATSAWTTINNRYRGGLSTYLDVLAAEDVMIAARRNAAVLHTRAFALDVALTRALGGGFQS
ncbi:MAG: efflux transporter outer membrane subunit [Caulobacterales bacterium]